MSSFTGFLPYGKQFIDDDDIAAVTRILRSGSLTGGPAVTSFENAFATRVGATHAVACANGTAALHLTALAIGLGPGDLAIVPSLTFLATANAPAYVGADVVFADVDPDTGLLTVDTLKEAIARADRIDGRLRAVFPVHLNGACVDLSAIAGALASCHDVCIIDDACHALGAEPPFGCIGDGINSDMTIFSLHPVKAITMGEGGVISTRNPEFASRLTMLRSHGMIRDQAQFVQPNEAYDSCGRVNPWYYEMQEPGFNYRASEIQCALGESQLGKLDKFLERRSILAQHYNERLASFAPILRPVPRVGGRCDGWHLYPVLIDFASLGISRGDLVRELSNRGIGSQVHYLPVHRQPYWRARQPETNLPGADAYYARCLSLPFFPTMTMLDVDRVVDTLDSIMR